MKYSSLFRYRSVWMAVASAAIIMFHSQQSSGSNFLNMFYYFGYFGVDIFLFASGIGCYFSYSKDKDFAGFIKRRALRILPVYLPFILIWCIVRLAEGRLDGLSALGNILCLQFIIDEPHSFNWYMNAIWILYLFLPLFFILTQTADRHNLRSVFVIVLTVLSFPFLSGSFGNKTHLLMTRLPIFFIGMCFACVSRRKEKLPWYIAASFILAVPAAACFMFFVAREHIDWLTCFGIYWYPFIVAAPGICIIISGVCELISGCALGKLFVKAADKVGAYSFEVFLLHFTAMDITMKYVEVCAPGPIKPFVLFFAMLIPAAIVLKFAAQRITESLKQKQKAVERV